MQTPTSAIFSIDLQDSQRFAHLCGDFNPLHVDPLAARRTPFGSTVVHGIHLLLKSVDIALDRTPIAAFEPVQAAATFNGPVHSCEEISVGIEWSDNLLRISGASKVRKAFTFSFTLARDEALAAQATLQIPESLEFPAAAPELVHSTGPGARGNCQATFGRAQLSRLFPALARCTRVDWIADLLASTHVVGMRYPGLHSIYAGFDLKRRPAGAALSDGLFHYIAGPVDPRFGMSHIEVDGVYFQGRLETVFRQPPVEQLSLREVAQRVKGTECTGHRALVIGGSRGLGELAAKCILASGGEVLITYASGAEDAQRICREAGSGGYRCTALAFDVLRADPLQLQELLAGGSFTHIYYFASPRIQRTHPQRWDATLFAIYARVYLDAFARLVQEACAATRQGAVPEFFYPSTVYVDTNEKGFAEYVVAKAAGEKLCQQFAARLKTGFHAPRLPRMRTDQTSGTPETGMADALEVISSAVRQMHSGRTTA